MLVATYDNAAIYADALGNQYALLICDECHHLPSAFTRVIAESSLAPFRLGLTATWSRLCAMARCHHSRAPLNPRLWPP